MRHCVPSNVSSGLGSLPLPYVYVDGKPDLTRPTIPALPTGERLNGSTLYRGIMSYFTASPITPGTITKQANIRLKQLYPEVWKHAVFSLYGNRKCFMKTPLSTKVPFQRSEHTKLSLELEIKKDCLSVICRIQCTFLTRPGSFGGVTDRAPLCGPPRNFGNIMIKIKKPGTIIPWPKNKQISGVISY